ncbi:hypothetical protein J2X11_002830 [Aeromicrobium panaciterrae]|uniref:Uncharacterized protein n=1 Tax=Aeromicrobium panaciterrae TaxID=363861 RepID=A0ABU1US37_9ACTN|nr:hypothetical protein [Aeromicrobium panaciterrae]MDR7087991.1 hypothetical protein [Aeromicrobium panaciterrae]
MSSTIVRRLGAAISVSALALTLGTVPSSADESPAPFSSKSSVLEDRPNARLATGADLKKASADRAAGSAAITATPTVNVVEIDAFSAVMNHPEENYIDVDVWLNEGVDYASIDNIALSLIVGDKKTGPYDVYFDEVLEVTFIVVPDTTGLGKARFYGSKVYYTPESEKSPTWDSTDSNSFYIRRDVFSEAGAEVEVSNEGKTKKFIVGGMGIYSPTIDQYKTLGSIKLQYKSGGEWHTKKTITLNNEGYGTYTFTKTTKYYYRIISGQTSTWIGFKQSFSKI